MRLSRGGGTVNRGLADDMGGRRCREDTGDREIAAIATRGTRWLLALILPSQTRSHYFQICYFSKLKYTTFHSSKFSAGMIAPSVVVNTESHIILSAYCRFADVRPGVPCSRSTTDFNPADVQTLIIIIHPQQATPVTAILQHAYFIVKKTPILRSPSLKAPLTESGRPWSRGPRT